MSYGLAGAFALFALVALFTPGPNNIMLMTSGLNFGVNRTMPVMFGVALGFGAMVGILGLGLGAVLQSYPIIFTIVKYAGSAYLLYLAWLVGTSGEVKAGWSKGRPISFLEAVALQWINPKGWVMAVGAVTTYAALAPFPVNILFMVGFFTLFGMASSWTWVMFGTGLRHIVTEKHSVRIFNLTMALLLVLSVVWALVES